MPVRQKQTDTNKIEFARRKVHSKHHACATSHFSSSAYVSLLGLWSIDSSFLAIHVHLSPLLLCVPCPTVGFDPARLDCERPRQPYDLPQKHRLRRRQRWCPASGSTGLGRSRRVRQASRVAQPGPLGRHLAGGRRARGAEVRGRRGQGLAR